MTGTYWAGDPNGLTDTREPTAFGEVGRYTARYFGSDLLDIQYAVRDNLGRIVEMVESVEGGAPVTSKYVYDAAGRLHQVKDAADQVIADYEYDLNGNRAEGSYHGEVEWTAAVYDDQDRLTTYTTEQQGIYTTTSFTYSDNGEVATKTVGTDTTSYVYDVLGNLRRVTLHDGQPTEQVIDYLVDGKNRRVGKKVEGELVKQWVYDGQLKIVGELDGAGNLVAQFVYASKSNVPDYMLKYGAAAGTYRIISDHLGSPRLVVDVSDGSVVQRMDFDEFGNVLADTAPGFQPFGFAGGIYDTDTGLVRFGARDYDAVTGRWTAKDPIRFKGGDTDLYGYVVNDPVNLSDPSGEAISPFPRGCHQRDCAVEAALYYAGCVAEKVACTAICARVCKSTPTPKLCMRACGAILCTAVARQPCWALAANYYANCKASK